MIRTFFGRRRATTVIAATILVIGTVTGSLVAGPPPRLLEIVATGLETVASDHQFLTLLTATLFANNWFELLLFLGSLMVVIGAAELVLGPWRLVVAYAFTAVAALALGIGVQDLASTAPGVWPSIPSEALQVDPFIPVVGVALTASAFCGPLWRRRIRVIGLTGSAMFLLYSGQSADLYRACAAVLGLALGITLRGRGIRPRWERSSHHEARALLAAVVGMSAVGPLLAIVSPHGYGLLRPLGLLFSNTLPSVHRGVAVCVNSPACIRDIELARLNGPGAVLLTVLPLLVLGVAAIGIQNGRRFAAVVAVVVSALLGLFAAFYFGLLPALLDPGLSHLTGRDGIRPLQIALAVLVPIGIAVLVALNLRHCSVRARSGSARRLFVAITGTVSALALSYVLSALAPSAYDPVQTPAGLLVDLPERFVPVGFLRQQNLDFVPISLPAEVLFDWMGAVSWSVLLGGLLVSSRSMPVTTREGEAAARTALLAGSSGSIGYMATWNGTRHWVAPDGEHVVGYRVAAGVAVALSEPLGPVDGRADAAHAFVQFCSDLGLVPAFYAVASDFAARIERDHRWAHLVVGEDTIIDTDSFSMVGKRWQDVRSSFNRAERGDVAAVWTSWEHLTLWQRAQLEAISEEWVASRGLPEMGFTLGGLEQLKDPAVALMLAVGPNMRIEAVTSWLPVHRSGEIVGWTLDFMRRRGDSMNGIMEFLIASTVLRAKQYGVATVSLSVAPLSRTPNGEPSPVDALLHRLATLLEPAYGFRSLAAFKSKFAPRHEAVSLVYQDALALPMIAIALTRIYLPELSPRSGLQLARVLNPARFNRPARR